MNTKEKPNPDRTGLGTCEYGVHAVAQPSARVADGGRGWFMAITQEAAPVRPGAQAHTGSAAFLPATTWRPRATTVEVGAAP
jgi:hypothetical protein